MPNMFKIIAKPLFLTLAFAAGLGHAPAWAQAKVLKVALGSMVASMDPNAKTSGHPQPSFSIRCSIP